MIQMMQRSVVKTVINELELDDKQYKPNVVYNRISSAKNSLIGPAEYMNDWASATGRCPGKPPRYRADI